MALVTAGSYDRWRVVYHCGGTNTNRDPQTGLLPWFQHVPVYCETEEEGQRVARDLIGTARDGGTVAYARAVPVRVPHIVDDDFSYERIPT